MINTAMSVIIISFDTIGNGQRIIDAARGWSRKIWKNSLKLTGTI